MNIFLSYAEENREIAGVIAGRLESAGYTLFNWLDPAQRGKRIIQNIEDGMKRADAYLALLSPSYLASYWCKQELGIATKREQSIQERHPQALYIYVAAVEQVASDEAGVIGNYDAVMMTSVEQREPALKELVDRFERAERRDASLGGLPDAPSPAVSGQPESPAAGGDGDPGFRNRDEELRRVLDGLTNTAGSHFWCVVAPPQLGKTWFLQRISRHSALSGPQPWAVRDLDLRERSAAPARGDVMALLGRMFGHVWESGEETLRIAQGILATGRSHLCLLDSAELLTGDTAAALRVCVSEIHDYVAERDVRFAFIAASRLDDDWKGVTPSRFEPLPLTGFNTDVVQRALQDLAAEMNNTAIPPARMREHAIRVHHVTEGLPALLVHCLRWVRDEQWLRMDRLDGQERFEAFAGPYIRRHLLTPAILLPAGPQDDGKLAALTQAYRVLVPYRLFTFSHLRYYQESDSDFRVALESAGWVLDDLWQAIRGTALLKRPLHEAWKEIHPPIRRLLYRYFYRTDEQGAEAQHEARKFVETWSDGLAGIEQAVALVECLWHEAAALRIREPAAMEERLIESARALSRGLRESGVSVPELREYVAERMRSDAEFQDAVGDGDGLLSRLAGMVLAPGEP